MSELPPVFICVDDRGSLWRYRRFHPRWIKERIVYAEWRINEHVDHDDAIKAFADAVELYVPVEREDKS